MEEFKKSEIVERAKRVQILGELERQMIQDPETLFARIKSCPVEISIADDMYRFVLTCRQDYNRVMEVIRAELDMMISGKGEITRHKNLLSGEKSEQ